MAEANSKFESWAIVELMGHQQLAGFVQQVEMGSSVFLRVDVPDCPAGEGIWQPAVPAFTKFVAPGAVYAITPCTEEVAKRAVVRYRPRPVQNLDLSVPALPAPQEQDDDADDIDDDGNDDLIWRD